MRTSAAKPCRSSGCDSPPSCVASSLAPRGDGKHTWLATTSERRALALLPSCPPLAPSPQHPRPTANPSVPFFAKKHFANAAPAPLSEQYLRLFSREKNIGQVEREIHVMVYGYYDFPKPSVYGFPIAAKAADRSCRYLV
jgi:hypothetical protein